MCSKVTERILHEEKRGRTWYQTIEQYCPCCGERKVRYHQYDVFTDEELINQAEFGEI